MINLLRMDFHRFFTNKMMYILLLVFIALQIFGIFMIKQYEEPIPGEVLMSSMNAIVSVAIIYKLIFTFISTRYKITYANRNQ